MPPELDLSTLTPSELQVLERALTGSTVNEIGRQLSVSEATVRTHLSHIYAKLRVRGRVDLLARLQGHGPHASDPSLQAAPAKASPLGVAAAVLGTTVMLVGLGLYQAWWTIVFGIGGFAVAMLTRRSSSPGRSRRYIFPLAVSAAFAALGLVVVVFVGLVGGQYGGACSSDVCTKPGADMFLFGGAILVLLGVVAFGLSIRSGLRARRNAK